jgi:hypothetical protein
MLGRGAADCVPLLGSGASGIPLLGSGASGIPLLRSRARGLALRRRDTRRIAMLGRRARFALCCGRAGGGAFAMTGAVQDRLQAAQEAQFCERVLAKSGDTVLTDALRGATGITTWAHYPAEDVFDPETGAQWFYHCHDPASDAREHGHFHCFVRPEGRTGPIHHLAAVGVDAQGRLIRLFTVNQWVVGDQWADAEATIALLDRFDSHHARPGYLVNRWLTAILRLYGDEVRGLIRARDVALNARGGDDVRQDRSLEVTSSLDVDLRATAASLGLAAG